MVRILVVAAVLAILSENGKAFGDLIVIGEPGLPGAPGATGATGAAGAPGATGETGAKGEKGGKGDKGSAGLMPGAGATGATGLPGDIGIPGPTGSDGQPGLTGQTGFTGATGATGSTGATGNSGVKGEPGLPGNDGPRNVEGPQGPKGEKGEPGRNGEQGATGFKGPQGPTGKTGPAGENDTNPCFDNACPVESDCSTTSMIHTCICNEGYLYDKTTKECQDVDECLENLGGCDEECFNTPPGSYTCSCTRAGYMLSPLDNHTCIDINECLKQDSCTGEQEECVNTYGGFICVDLTPVSSQTAAANTGSVVVSTDMFSDSLLIILVIWIAGLTILLIIIAIIMIMKRQNQLTVQKLVAKSRTQSR